MTKELQSPGEARPDDRILDGYSEWLNEQLFMGKGEEDTILWLGANRWLIASNLDPGELFVVEIKRARLDV